MFKISKSGCCGSIYIYYKAYQHIPTSHIPTWWEYVIMMKGGNMTQSHSHHVKIHHLYIDDHFEGK